MDIASLSLEVRSDQVKEATVALREMVPAASAAERAAQKWGLTTDAAAQSTEDFSRRVQSTIRNLEFERQQLARSATEKERYNALHRAGVSAASAEGQAITASVVALQAQRDAARSAGESHTAMGQATRAAGTAASGLITHLRALAIAYISVETARKLWEIGMKAGDLGHQAEQIGVNTDQLQAYRLAGAQAGVASEEVDTAITKLARSMGAAAGGNKEMIELFQKLKVNLLDARGELRPTADVLPEVARGLLSVGSSSQRTADEMTLFGRSGAKMASVLKDFAAGNDAVVASARAKNALISPEAIEAWDKLGNRMKVTEQVWSTLIAEFGADVALPVLDHLKGLLESTRKELEGIKAIWQWIMSNMDAARRADARSAGTPSANDTQNLKDRLAALRQNPTQFGFQASEKALTEQLAAREDAAKRMQSLVDQSVFQMDESDARRQKLPISAPPLGATSTGAPGVSNPAVKGQAESYQKIIASAQQYVAMKNIETNAIGMNAEAAARLKHEQELLGKATEGNLVLGPAQIAQLKGLAAAMAEADAKFASAKFMDDAAKKSKEFIAAQEIERQSLFMSAEAAAAYRIEQELLNKAANDNIVLTTAQTDKIRQLAAAQAAAGEKTRQTKEIFDLARDVTKGFFSDMVQGLRQGQSVWESFGNAATNALNKISDKLMDMAVNKLFDAAFGGSSGGGGGLLGGLFNSIFGNANSGGFASIGSGAGSTGGVPNFTGMANGGIFDRGNVVPFAGGGIVNQPTLFPFARGTGLMGEAGPEGILPLRRGRNGRLGVEANGGGGDRGDTYVVTNHMTFGSDVDRATLATWAEVVKKQSVDAMFAAVRRGGARVKATFG